MKKWMMTFSLAVSIILLLNAGTAYAEVNGRVIYDGEARKFIFEPGSSYSPDDLFPSFKNMMPGETVSQEIQIKNKSSNRNKVDIYLRSLGADEDDREFLSYLSLIVNRKNGEQIFNDTPYKPSQLSDWVHLGTFQSGEESVLDLKVKVSEKLGNEWQDAAGSVKWEFKVEETDESSKPSDAPDKDNTNGNSNLGWLPQTGKAGGRKSVMAFAGIALILIGAAVKPKKLLKSKR